MEKARGKMRVQCVSRVRLQSASKDACPVRPEERCVSKVVPRLPSKQLTEVIATALAEPVDRRLGGLLRFAACIERNRENRLRVIRPPRDAPTLVVASDQQIDDPRRACGIDTRDLGKPLDDHVVWISLRTPLHETLKLLDGPNGVEDA